jgi:hypothetical protein
LSASPFGQIDSGIIEINAPLLKMDRDWIERLLKSEYSIPAPKGKGLDWDRLLINITSGRHHQGKAGNDDNWHVPEDSALLALYASPVRNPPGQAAATAEDTADSAILSGLVLARKEGDTYERISMFTKLLAKGMSNATSESKTVKII